MSDRREFVSTLTFSLAGVALPQLHARRATAPQVDAEATVFYGHPDGRNNLVRFVVRGLDTPAGRIRVFAGGRRLVGTAGVLRSGDNLYGELWLPLDRPTTVTSVLDAPGLPDPHWTTHTLRPRMRWTIVWLTPADPAAISAGLQKLPPLNRVIQTAILKDAGVLGNPLSPASRLPVLDHPAFLRMGVGARDLERTLGIPASPVAFTNHADALPHSIVLALSGAGVSYVICSDDNGPPLERWEGPDGSQVLAARITPGGDPRSLGFANSPTAMVAAVEAWLTEQEHTASSSSSSGMAFLASGQPDSSIGRMAAAVHEWNRRFAYPRILMGPSDELERRLRDTAAGGTAVVRRSHPSRLTIPDLATLTDLARRRSEEHATNARAMILPLAAAVDPSATAQTAYSIVARQIDTAIAGFLVLNTAPIRRTDTVELPDGRSRLVTDVPAAGYAFEIEDPGTMGTRAAVSQSPSTPVAENSTYRLEIDRKTGAILSLVSRSDSREWVRGNGLNAVGGAILEELTREELPGTGVQLTAHRWSSDLQEFSSTITMYDGLPWIDLVNHVAGPQRGPLRYRFDFSAPDSLVRWEIPGGFQQSERSVQGAAHLRWLALRNDLDTIFFRGLDAPYFSIEASGSIVSYAPSGRTRYRIRAANFPAAVADCARFGWGAEPLVAVPVDNGPSGLLPRFGSLLVLDQPGASIIHLKQADDGNGLIVYLQEHLGEQSFLSLGPGLLTFDGARKVDFLERELDEPVTTVRDGVAFQSRPWGVTALRLLNVRISGG